MRILKLLLGISLFTLGYLFYFEGWGLVVTLLGIVLFASSFKSNEPKEEIKTKEISKPSVKTKSTKEPFKLNLVIVKGIIGLLIFIGLLVYAQSGFIIHEMFLEPDNLYSVFSQDTRFKLYTMNHLSFNIFIFLPLLAFSIWLMQDWINTWFK